MPRFRLGLTNAQSPNSQQFITAVATAFDDHNFHDSIIQYTVAGSTIRNSPRNRRRTTATGNPEQRNPHTSRDQKLQLTWGRKPGKLESTYATMTTSSAKAALRWYAALSPAEHALACHTRTHARGAAPPPVSRVADLAPDKTPPERSERRAPDRSGERGREGEGKGRGSSRRWRAGRGPAPPPRGRGAAAGPAACRWPSPLLPVSRCRYPRTRWGGGCGVICRRGEVRVGWGRKRPERKGNRGGFTTKFGGAAR